MLLDERMCFGKQFSFKEYFNSKRIRNYYYFTIISLNAVLMMVYSKQLCDLALCLLGKSFIKKWCYCICLCRYAERVSTIYCI